MLPETISDFNDNEKLRTAPFTRNHAPLPNIRVFGEGKGMRVGVRHDFDFFVDACRVLLDCKAHRHILSQQAITH